MTVQKLEELTGKLCDRYCIYARIFSSEDEQEKLDNICASCPMNGLFELLDIIPKCNIGDTVWLLVNDDEEYFIEENKINEVCQKGFFVSANFPPGDDFGDYILYEQIGKTVFLDKPSAENKLKEITLSTHK